MYRKDWFAYQVVNWTDFGSEVWQDLMNYLYPVADHLRRIVVNVGDPVQITWLETSLAGKTGEDRKRALEDLQAQFLAKQGTNISLFVVENQPSEGMEVNCVAARLPGRTRASREETQVSMAAAE